MRPARIRSLPARPVRGPLRGLARVLLGGLSAMAGLACLAALPYLLWILTRACLDSIDWVESAGQPINAPLLILAVVAAVWVWWGWVVYATVADTVAAVRGNGHRRMRLPVPLHRAVTAAAGLLGTLLQPGVAAAGTATASTPALQTHDTANLAMTTTVAGPPAAPVATVTAPSTAAAAPVVYVVRRGDALSRIAKTELGDAKRWPEIYTLNRGARFPGVGGTFTDPDVIYPGWRLRLPAPPAAPSPATVAAQEPPALSDTAPTTVASQPMPPPAPVGGTATPSGGTSYRLTDLLPWLTVLVAPVLVAVYRRRRSGTGPGVARAPKVRARTGPVPSVAHDDLSTPQATAPTAVAAAATVTPPDQREAARRVVVAALADDPALAVIVPRTTLRILVRDRAQAADSDALTVTATVDDAIAALETETLHRARLVAEHDVNDYADIRDLEALPRVVLVTHADPAQRTRIAATLAQGRAFDIEAIVLDRQQPTDRHDRPAPAPAPETPVAKTGDPTADTGVAAAAGKVRVRVLGDVAVLDRRGRPVPGFRGRAKELLTYLVVHRDGAEIPEITEAIWPDAVMSRANDRLATEVGNLRRTVRTAAGDGSVQAVDNPGGRYVLNTDVLDVDAWQFDQALSADRPDAPDRETQLRTAVGLHGGALAGTNTYPWIEAARERCRRQGIIARQRLAALVAPTRPAEAAALLDAAADVDPYSDTLACAAIEAHAALDDTDAVRHRYTQLRAALADIEEAPAAGTRAVVERILGRDALDDEPGEVSE